jgi:HEAT repeat protein
MGRATSGWWDVGMTFAATGEATAQGTGEASDRISALEGAMGNGDREAAILTALGDPSTLVRERAIALAARHLSPEALGALLGNGENAVLRNSAFAALERQGPYAVPHLLKLTVGGDSEVAMFSVQILSLINDSSASRALLPLLDHPDRNIAQSAIEALGNVQAIEAVPALIRLLTADLWLQFAAVVALGKLGDGQAVRPLLELCTHEVLAEPAIEALGRIGSPEALRPLVEILYSNDRIPQRDQVLRAVAATLERNPGAAAGSRIRAGLTEAGEKSGLCDWLRGLLGCDDVELARAAATVVVHLQLWELLPPVLLRSADPEEARWTAAFFRRCRKQTQPALLELLRSEDLRVRRGALACGAFDGRAVNPLLECMKDPEADVRAAACRALGALRKPHVIPALCASLRSDSSQERTAAAHALSQMPGPRLDVLEPDLDPALDADRIVTALEILESARSTCLADQVVTLLRDARPIIRRAALRVLRHHSGHGPDDRIVEMLADPDPSVRTEAVEALVRRRCHQAESALVALLEQADPLRYHVIRGLGRLQVASAAGKLMEIFATAPSHERIEIVAALNLIAAPGLLPFLKERLSDHDLETRRVASDGLARMATAADVAELVALSSDSDWTVRNHAAWGLGRLALPESRDLLLQLCRDVEPVVARTARVALGKLAGGTAWKTPSAAE